MQSRGEAPMLNILPLQKPLARFLGDTEVEIEVGWEVPYRLGYDQQTPISEDPCCFRYGLCGSQAMVESSGKIDQVEYPVLQRQAVG